MFKTVTFSGEIRQAIAPQKDVQKQEKQKSPMSERKFFSIFWWLGGGLFLVFGAFCNGLVMVLMGCERGSGLFAHYSVA